MSQLYKCSTLRVAVCWAVCLSGQNMYMKERKGERDVVKKKRKSMEREEGGREVYADGLTTV